MIKKTFILLVATMFSLGTVGGAVTSLPINAGIPVA